MYEIAVPLHACNRTTCNYIEFNHPLFNILLTFKYLPYHFLFSGLVHFIIPPKQCL